MHGSLILFAALAAQAWHFFFSSNWTLKRKFTCVVLADLVLSWIYGLRLSLCQHPETVMLVSENMGSKGYDSIRRRRFLLEKKVLTEIRR